MTNETTGEVNVTPDKVVAEVAASEYEKGYHEGPAWNDMPRWECDTEGCPFDTLLEENMIEHVRIQHWQPPAPPEFAPETEATELHEESGAVVAEGGQNAPN